MPKIRTLFCLVDIKKPDKTERAKGLGRRTREGIIIEKRDQTHSPEIPDRGGTSEKPGLRSKKPSHVSTNYGAMQVDSDIDIFHASTKLACPNTKLKTFRSHTGLPLSFIDLKIS